MPSGYSNEDKTRDFQKVFFGSDEGKRVFNQLQAICDPPMHPREVDSHGALAYRAGMKQVMAQIMTALTEIKEPTVEREPSA